MEEEWINRRGDQIREFHWELEMGYAVNTRNLHICDEC